MLVKARKPRCLLRRARVHMPHMTVRHVHVANSKIRIALVFLNVIGTMRGKSLLDLLQKSFTVKFVVVDADNQVEPQTKTPSSVAIAF